MYRKIRKAGVIGSGVMGGGIAALLAAAGIRTLLLDIVPMDLNEKEKTNPAARNKIAKAGLDGALLSSPPLFMQWKDADLISIGNLEDDFDKLAECDWIIEVVVENLKIKQNLFKRIEPVRKKGAIVSSNTSGIPLKAMSEDLGMEFKQHFLGTHFFNPVRYMKLLEIIPGEETLPEILGFMADFGERILGKGIVWAKDTPNFVGNRIGVQGIVKTMQLMVEKDLTIPDVDALFGPVLGRPKTGMFKTADIVGLDTLAHVAQNTYDLVDQDEARDSFVLPGFINEMIKKNILGKKTKAGFYKSDLTPEFKKIRKVINPGSFEYKAYDPPQFPCLMEARKEKLLSEKIKRMVYGDDKGAEFVWKALVDNLIYAANRIPEIADTIVEIDNAMKWGFNFEMGPFETWDAMGLKASVEKMKKEGLLIPEKIIRMLEKGHLSFYENRDGKKLYYDFESEEYKAVKISKNIISLALLRADNKVVESCKSASLIDLGDDVFCVEFHTVLNAINGEIVDFIQSASEYVDENGQGLVIGNQAGGMPGAFSAGGDLKFMAGLAKEGKYAEIESFVKTAQEGMQKIRYSCFPVVAAPYGMALGGGCEVCLGTADKILAHTDLYMGLVEIGVGLIPSGGGCLNLWKKFLERIPDAVTEFDLAKLFIPTFMNIAMAKFSSSASDAMASGFLGPRDRIVFNRDYLIGEAKKEIVKMVDEGYQAPVKRKIKVIGESAQGMINSELFNMLNAKFITPYDSFLARRIAFVLSGGDVRANSEIEEETILALEREAFIDFWKEKKTLERVEHMLKTGKPLRN